MSERKITRKVYRTADLKKRLAKNLDMPELRDVLNNIKQDPDSTAPPYEAQPGHASMKIVMAFANYLRGLISGRRVTKIKNRNNRPIITLLCFLILIPLFISLSGKIVVKADAAESPANITLKVTQGSPYDTVSGTVTGIEPYDARVVVFTRTNQWYVQPYEDERAYLTVNPDGTFQTWIRDWQQISAFVIRKEYNALSAKQAYKPFPLSVDGVDVLTLAAYPSIKFSGHEWAIKDGDYLGPGPNYFSSSHENIWVDDQGCLHLKITKRDENWYCAEVYLMQSLGFGTYIFQISSRVDLLDKNVVGSPFIYQDDTHELDVEFSRWGVDGGANAQFVVQPYFNPGNQEQFSISLPENTSTHIIEWQSEIVSFKSSQGHNLKPPFEQVIHQWEYVGGDVPSESDELAHINLWLLDGQAPSDNTEAEMVIKSFTFYVDECTPPPSGDWIVCESCTLLDSVMVNGNVYIEDNTLLTIAQGANLCIE